MRKHQVSFKKYSKEDILNMIAKSNLGIGKLTVPDQNKSVSLVSVNLRTKDRIPKYSLMYSRLLSKMRKLKMDTSGVEEAVRPALKMNYSELKAARNKFKRGRNTKPVSQEALEPATGVPKEADNLNKMALNIQEKKEAVKEAQVKQNKTSIEEDLSMTNNETGVDRGLQPPAPTASQTTAEAQNKKVYGSGGLTGQTAVKDVSPAVEAPAPPAVENTSSVIQTTPETILTEQVIDDKPALPAISQPAVAPETFQKGNEIETENKERKQKTTERLKQEIKCFRLIYQDLIKTKNWMRLQKKSLDANITKLRYCHAEYTEEIRKYYNKDRGLKVGVIVDPAILGLNVPALQNLLAPSMVNTFADNAVMNAKQPLMPNETPIAPVQPETAKPVVRPIDIHHRLGGVRHSLQQPPPAELRELTHTYNKQEREKMTDIKLHGKGNIRPDSYKNFHRRYYARPSSTQHIPIKIKTGH